jgi:hypothetical protein
MKNEKGRSPDWVVNWKASVGDHPVCALRAAPNLTALDPIVQSIPYSLFTCRR